MAFENIVGVDRVMSLVDHDVCGRESAEEGGWEG